MQEGGSMVCSYKKRDTRILRSYYRVSIELLKVFECYCYMPIKV